MDHFRTSHGNASFIPRLLLARKPAHSAAPALQGPFARRLPAASLRDTEHARVQLSDPPPPGRSRALKGFAPFSVRTVPVSVQLRRQSQAEGTAGSPQAPRWGRECSQHLNSGWPVRAGTQRGQFRSCAHTRSLWRPCPTQSRWSGAAGCYPPSSPPACPP